MPCFIVDKYPVINIKMPGIYVIRRNKMSETKLGTKCVQGGYTPGNGEP